MTLQKLRKNLRNTMRTALAISFASVLLVAFQNCEYTDKRPESGMSGNGSGYTGLRPDAGLYLSKLESGGCATTGDSHFETLTVRNDSDLVLVQNECDQSTKEIPITELSVEDYRKSHLVRSGKIYEKDMSREAVYANEVLCDFSDNKFGILIRWYDEVYPFHVGHLFTSTSDGSNGIPIIRYSDYNFGNGNFGTGYMGTDFQLAVLNNYQLSEDGFAGYFHGLVDGKETESLGLCVTTTYDCAPATLEVASSGAVDNYTVRTPQGAETKIDGTLVYNGDIGTLVAVVTTASNKIYDCRGYSSKLNNELAVGGCFDRPTQSGQTPKRVMIQIRGQIQWSSASQGTINGKICIQKNLPPSVSPSPTPSTLISPTPSP